MAVTIAELRTGRHAETAFLAAVVVGLILTAVHWVGLLLGGALVGLFAPSVSRALLTGLFFAVAVVVTWLVYLLVVGDLGAYLGMGIITYLSLGVAFVLPVLAAIAARGLTDGVSTTS